MIVTQEQLSQLRETISSEQQSIVFTNGCFDILHVGHVTYLQQAKTLGDILVVGLNSDDSVRRLKGQARAINNQDDRACVLDALRSVDYVVVFDEDTPYNVIKSVQPDVLVKGGDYAIADIVGGDIVRERGGNVCVLPFVQGKSTTAIIERAAKQ
ncbi:MAG: D-glycero-beta-D-manno-heptose 1-phosphate adenylyltransferase [Ignavibacteria bacterium]|nr:D-glycero-beta-D-manno-heptose 1-phosphate adenylyltransferase [Ignavibacteria bacterium]